VIYISPLDGLTRPLVKVNAAPGEDELTYIEVDTEEDIRTDLSLDMNRAMKDWQPDLDLKPWPWPLPRQVYLDFSIRYQWFNIQLWQWDYVTNLSAQLAAGQATVQDNSDVLARSGQRALRKANVGEIQAIPAPGFSTATRLGIRNEGGGTILKEPLVWLYHGQQDQRYYLVLPDNELFTPFDLTEPARYAALDANGEAVDVASFCYVKEGQVLELILRPRRWKWIVQLIAHFEYEDWFGSAPSDEYFVSTFFMRPPFNPYRFDQANANPATWDFPDSFGNLVGYDVAIDNAWDLSWHSRDLRRQILDQQFFDMCEAYVFLGNDPPTITIQALPPRIGEVVCGIAKFDQASGSRDVVWLVQNSDASLVYPQHTVGMFYSMWEA
jgi:hypothetical protein